MWGSLQRRMREEEEGWRRREGRWRRGEGAKSMTSTAAAAAAAMERMRRQVKARARARRGGGQPGREGWEGEGGERKCMRMIASAAAATRTAEEEGGALCVGEGARRRRWSGGGDEPPKKSPAHGWRLKAKDSGMADAPEKAERARCVKVCAAVFIRRCIRRCLAGDAAEGGPRLTEGALAQLVHTEFQFRVTSAAALAACGSNWRCSALKMRRADKEPSRRGCQIWAKLRTMKEMGASPSPMLLCLQSLGRRWLGSSLSSGI
jgi:hypothetical protein